MKRILQIGLVLSFFSLASQAGGTQVPGPLPGMTGAPSAYSDFFGAGRRFGMLELDLRSKTSIAREQEELRLKQDRLARYQKFNQSIELNRGINNITFEIENVLKDLSRIEAGAVYDIAEAKEANDKLADLLSAIHKRADELQKLHPKEVDMQQRKK